MNLHFRRLLRDFSIKYSSPFLNPVLNRNNKHVEGLLYDDKTQHGPGLASVLRLLLGHFYFVSSSLLDDVLQN